jgi:hypothetical protein
MKYLTTSRSTGYVWSVFCIIGTYGEKTQRIATVCSKNVAYHIALKHQLEESGQCYIAWTHKKEAPDVRLRLLHKNSKSIDPIFFVKSQILEPSTRLDRCPMCSVGGSECLTQLR